MLKRYYVTIRKREGGMSYSRKLQIWANSIEEASKHIETELQTNPKYFGYKLISIKSVKDRIYTNCDIIDSLQEKEVENMAYFNINWNDYTETIANLAKKESWSNETYPDNKILTNYMVHTYKKLTSERNIITNREYGIFNTGLFTEFYQPIYAYHDKDGLQFLTAYELGNMNITERPPRANYFEDPSLLLFDWHYEININYKHILKDLKNIDRLPEKLKDDKNILNNYK